MSQVNPNCAAGSNQPVKNSGRADGVAKDAHELMPCPAMRAETDGQIEMALPGQDGCFLSRKLSWAALFVQLIADRDAILGGPLCVAADPDEGRSKDF